MLYSHTFFIETSFIKNPLFMQIWKDYQSSNEQRFLDELLDLMEVI